MAPRYKHNIRTWYARATAAEVVDGMAWYDDAFLHATYIATTHGISLQRAAGVIAALSPRNRWERNLRDAENLTAWYVSGANPYDCPPVATFNGNKQLAIRILSGEHPIDVLTSRKVRAFYLSILGDTHAVCVDTWAIRAATMGKVDTVPNDGTFRAVADAYRAVAQEHGIRPADLQAVVWVAVRNAS